MTSLAITFDDIAAAAARIAPHAHRTPVLTSRTADARAGATLFFKCENLQRMGAFKFRGAYNALAQFTPEQRRRGVVAFSSGNHAQAIALAARAARHAGDDRDAARRAGGEGRGDARLRRRGGPLRPLPRGPRSDSAAGSRTSAA